MQVVINIDADRYKSICDGVEAGKRVNVPSLYAHKIIANGTPLPKGHGRLIDENNLWFEDIDDISCVTQRNVENAPTIIEAESEG